MGNSNLLRNPRFLTSLLIFGGLCAVTLLNGIFIFGGSVFYQLATTLINPVVALVASFLFFRARVVVKDPNFQHLWLWMGISFGLWGVAEAIWALYALVITQGNPTLTFADLLWIIGYIPIYYAFSIRQRTLKNVLTAAQKWMIVIISLVAAIASFTFGILPVLNNFGSESLLERLVFLTYPVGDLGLVIMSCLALILIKGGRYSLSWRLIFTGIFVMAFSDILYNYANWNGIYYPENQLNLISNVVDTTYILSYVLVGYGAYVYGLLWEIKELPDMRLTVIPTSRYLAFVGTNRENQVISTSENLYWLMNARSDSLFYRLSMAEACGIDPQIMQNLTDKIIRKGSLYQEEVSIITVDKKPRTVFLSALATYDIDNEFTGVNFVLRANIKTPDDLLWPKSRDLQAITRHVLSAASLQIKEQDQALRVYFLETLRMLFSVLSQFGGERQKEEILARLNDTFQQKNVQAEISDQVIAISEDYEGEELSLLLSDTLENARSLVSKVVGEQVVREKMGEFEQETSRSLPGSLDRNRLRMHVPQSG